MIIFNHPCFPAHFAAFWRLGAAFRMPGAAAFRARLDSQKAGSAPNMHTIKPNKAEAKNRRNRRLRHREGSESGLADTELDFAEEVSIEQHKKEGS